MATLLQPQYINLRGMLQTILSQEGGKGVFYLAKSAQDQI